MVNMRMADVFDISPVTDRYTTDAHIIEMHVAALHKKANKQTWYSPMRKTSTRTYEPIDYVKVNFIIETITNYFNTTLEDVSVKSRKPHLVHVRHLIAFFLRMETPMGLRLIAEKIGGVEGKDHTTVIHSVNTVKGYLKVNDERTINDVRTIYQRLADGLSDYEAKNRKAV